VKRTEELGKLLVGAVLEADDPKQLMLAAGLHPEDLGDRFLASCWTIVGQVAQEGRRLNAAELFAAGVTRKMLGADDLRVLQSLQAQNTLDEQGFMRVAEELRKAAHAHLVGRELAELGNQILSGKTEPAAAHARFRSIAESYARLHAAGRRGSEVVIVAAEEHERRKREGRPGMVSTGIAALDRLTGGFPLKLCLMLGPPATFKSGLMGTMLRRQLAAGVRPLIVSLEDRDTWVVKRYLAADLGMKVRDVFNAPFPNEARATEALNSLSNEMRDAWFLTRQHVRTAEDIVRVATQYKAQHDINLVYVDNARAVKASIDPCAKWREDRRIEQSRMYELFAEWADTYQVPLVLLAHTSRKYFDRTHGGKGPPIMSDIGETSDAEKDIRLLLSLWKRRGALRVTVGKQNESNTDDAPTVELGMLGESALVDADSGIEIDLRAESRRDRDAMDDAKEEQARRHIVEREQWNAKRRAELAMPAQRPDAAAQGELLDLPEVQA
jgi:replicative DNA helicase